MNWIKNPRNRVRAALILLILSLIGYPLTALTIAKTEPPIVLFLSWFAITLTSLDILATADVRENK